MKIYKLNGDTDIQKFLFISAFRNKFDLAANQISKNVFESIIENKDSFLKKFPEFNCEIQATIKKISDDYIEHIKGFEYRRFGISACNKGAFVGNLFEYSYIFIDIVLSSGFSNRDYDSLNYSLYESIRHELEHINTFETEGKPDEEYMMIIDKMFKSIPPNSPEKLLEHCSLISSYFLNPQEIIAHSKSIYFISKKKRQDFKKTIEEVFNRVFFNNNIENIKIGKEDKRISSIVETTKNELIKKINSNFPNSLVVMKSLPYYG